MKISELAKATGLSAKTIRFYEAEGLIPDPPRTGSGYRAYAGPDVVRVGFILKAKRLGLSLDEIKGILQLHDRREPTCMHVRSLMEEKVAQIETVIQDLMGFKEELESLSHHATSLVDCRPIGGNICSIIEQSGIKLTPSSSVWAEPLGHPGARS
ncbi:MAG: heavy metal-responsive transcriptional regulator [Chloroflexi bacterium]|nr:heavy metal-responsive transcriptional regulator [Chloroflexota bacterium]